MVDNLKITVLRKRNAENLKVVRKPREFVRPHKDRHNLTNSKPQINNCYPSNCCSS